MRVALPEALLTIPRPTSGDIKTWAVGQLLTATVIGRDTKNSIRLRIDGEPLQASTDLPLRVGARITLEVVRNGAVPVLRALPAPQEQHRAAVRDALRQALPRQQPLVPVFDRLVRLISDASKPAAPALPPPVQRLVGTMLLALPTVSDVTNPPRLADKLRDSGIGLEAKLQRRVLAGSAKPPETDLKWQLLRIRHAADQAAAGTAPSAPGPSAREPPPDAPRVEAPRPGAPAGKPPLIANAAPPEPARTAPGREQVQTRPATGAAVAAAARTGPGEPLPPAPPDNRGILSGLRHQIDGAIARIEATQLQILNTGGDVALHLLFELPIRVADTFDLLRLEVDQDAAAQAAENGAPLTVTLEISMPHSGPLTARLALQAASLTVCLWSDDADLRQRILSNQDWLMQRLQAAGLEPRSVVVAPVAVGGHGRADVTGFIDIAI